MVFQVQEGCPLVRAVKLIDFAIDSRFQDSQGVLFDPKLVIMLIKHRIQPVKIGQQAGQAMILELKN